jgi:hypothetical protein
MLRIRTSSWICCGQAGGHGIAIGHAAVAGVEQHAAGSVGIGHGAGVGQHGAATGVGIGHGATGATAHCRNWVGHGPHGIVGIGHGATGTTAHCRNWVGHGPHGIGRATAASAASRTITRGVTSTTMCSVIVGFGVGGVNRSTKS